MFDHGVYAVLHGLQSAILCYANAVLMPLYALLYHAMPCYAILRYAVLGCLFFVVDDVVVVVVPVAIVVGGVVACCLCVSGAVWCCLVLSGAVWCCLVCLQLPAFLTATSRGVGGLAQPLESAALGLPRCRA